MAEPVVWLINKNINTAEVRLRIKYVTTFHLLFCPSMSDWSILTFVYIKLVGKIPVVDIVKRLPSVLKQRNKLNLLRANYFGNTNQESQ